MLLFFKNFDLPDERFFALGDFDVGAAALGAGERRQFQMVGRIFFHAEIAFVSAVAAFDLRLNILKNEFRVLGNGALKTGLHPKFHLFDAKEREFSHIDFHGFDTHGALFFGLCQNRSDDGLTNGGFVHLSDRKVENRDEFGDALPGSSIGKNDPDIGLDF